MSELRGKWGKVRGEGPGRGNSSGKDLDAKKSWCI